MYGVTDNGADGKGGISRPFITLWNGKSMCDNLALTSGHRFFPCVAMPVICDDPEKITDGLHAREIRIQLWTIDTEVVVDR